MPNFSIPPVGEGRADFALAIEKVLLLEGGFVNDPQDHGGATNFGITAAQLAESRGHPVTTEDVKNLTKDEAKQIYYSSYWLRVSGDKIGNQDLAEILFDSAVNFGITAASRRMQQVLLDMGYFVKVDGVFGPKSVSALNSAKHRDCIYEFARLTIRNYGTICVNNPTQLKFLIGWQERAAKMFQRLV